jgi:hypothetical protein
MQLYILVLAYLRKRRRKGNPVPEVYLRHPVPGGYKYGDLALQVGRVSRVGTIIYGLGDCSGEDQQQQ